MRESSSPPRPESRPETSDERLLRSLVDEAQSLLSRYKNRDEAIWQALSNSGIDDHAYRIKLFRKINAKLNRQKQSDADATQEEEEIMRKERKQALLRDARANELRQPRDAWDSMFDPDDTNS